MTTDFGDECEIILPDNQVIDVGLNTFDALEYECMNLISNTPTISVQNRIKI